MTMEMFKDICRMSQKGLKKHVAKQLREKYTTVISDDGFVYAKGDFPVLLVAHLDTVHKKLPGKIKYNKGKLSSPNGIGGDDRCGVYMIFDIIKEYNCSVLFCEDEEIGGVGSDKFIKTKLAGELVGTFNNLIEKETMMQYSMTVQIQNLKILSQKNSTKRSMEVSRIYQLLHHSLKLRR